MATLPHPSPRARRTLARALGKVLLVTGVLLLVPLVAMCFTSEVAWTGFDFAVAAALLAGTGCAIELARARLATRKSRVLAVAAILGALLVVWAELAVGILR